MKVALYSDLHYECGSPFVPPASAETGDLVILAGDIGGHTKGLLWASNAFPLTPVVYVAGNHEYYNAHLGLLDELRRTAKRLGIHFLDRDTLLLEKHGVRILGCTLWSGFDLYGNGDPRTHAMAVAKRHINDYWMIGAHGGKRLEPSDTLKLHRKSAVWLEAELAKPFAGKTIVVTHFAPHRRCIAPQHEGSPFTPYFVTDMAPLLTTHRIDLWCHGHTHTNNDFVAEGGCRVVSNQRGYPGERPLQTRAAAGPHFREDLLIEL